MAQAKKKPKQSKRRTKHKRTPPACVDPAFLTDDQLRRREAFAQAYCAEANATKAAEIAGWTGTKQSMRVTASRLLAEPGIKNRIAEIREELISELKITNRAILAEHARIAFLDGRKLFDDMGEILPMNALPTELAHAVSGYTVERKRFGEGDEAMETEKKEVKFCSKQDSLKFLARYSGMEKEDDRGKTVSVEEFLARLLAARNRVLAMRDDPAFGRLIEHEPAG